MNTLKESLYLAADGPAGKALLVTAMMAQHSLSGTLTGPVRYIGARAGQENCVISSEGK